MTEDRKLVTKSEDLPPLILSPSSSQQVQRLANDSGEVVGIAMAVELLGAHADPLVRVAAGKIKDAIREWSDMKAKKSAIAGGACDHYDLVLPAAPSPEDRLTIGNSWAAAVQITVDAAVEDKHVTLEFVDGNWSASTNPDHRNPTRYRWLLNGDVVEPREVRPIKTGDEIRVGHSVVHVRAAE